MITDQPSPLHQAVGPDAAVEPEPLELKLLDVTVPPPPPPSTSSNLAGRLAPLPPARPLRELLLWGLLEELHGRASTSDQDPPSKDVLAMAIHIRDWVIAKSAGTDAVKFFKIRSAPEKSALLMRILSGQAPLRHAPPTSFGYPNYGLIEGPANLEHTCHVSFSSFPANAGSRRFAIIDQRPWRVVSCNGPAGLIQRMLAGGEAAFDADQFQRHLDLGPVWRVSCSTHWPEFELCASTAVSTGRRDLVERVTAPTFKDVTGAGWGPLQALGTGTFVQLRRHCWALRKTEAWKTPGFTGEALYMEPPALPILGD